MTKVQKIVLLAAILASLVAFLDSSVVSVALPAIASELGTGLASQQWVVDAYLISLGSLMLIAGSLSDIFGRKKILKIGLIGFGIASLACAFAPSSGFLIGGRLLQGVAGALLVPSSLALIFNYFDGGERAKAVGHWTAWTGIAFIIGPLLGGWLVDSVSWRLVFAINVLPIVVTWWLLNQLSSQEVKAEHAKVDVVGAILCAIGLGASVFSLIEQPNYGWRSPLIFLTLGVGLVGLLLFFIYERRIKQPMLPLKIFSNRNFRFGNLATLFIYGALSAGMFVITIFLQQVSGYTALAAGMAFLPVTLLLFFFSSKVGKLADRLGSRWFMTFGPIVAALGYLLLLRTSVAAHYASQLLPGILLLGIGLTLTVTPLVEATLGGIDKRQEGVASAINNAAARLAGLIAIAALGAVVALQFKASINKQLPNVSQNVKATVSQSIDRPLNIDVTAQGSDLASAQAVLSSASLSAFRLVIALSALLLIGGGIISAAGIQNPKPAKSRSASL